MYEYKSSENNKESKRNAGAYNQFSEGGGYSKDLRWTNKLSYDLRLGSLHGINAFVAYESDKKLSRYDSGIK